MLPIIATAVATLYGATALAAASFLHQANAHLIPLCGAAVVVLSAHAGGYPDIRTGGGAVGLAAVALAGTTIVSAVDAMFTGVTTAVAAISGATALPTAQLLHQLHAHLVPLAGAAEVILSTYASLYPRIAAPGRTVGLAAVPFTLALAAIHLARIAVFTGRAHAIPAKRLLPGTGIATILHNFRGARLVPYRVAAVPVHCTDAGHNCRLPTSGRPVGLAALSHAPTAIVLAGPAGLAVVAGPVSTALPGRAGPAAEFLHFLGTLKVPIIAAAPLVLLTYALLHRLVLTAWSTVRRTAIGNRPRTGRKGQHAGQNSNHKGLLHDESSCLNINLPCGRLCNMSYWK